MADLEELLGRLEGLLGELEGWDPEVRGTALEILDGVDALHRLALTRLAEELGAANLVELRSADPVVAWLFDAYGIGLDERLAVERALDAVRPYVESHGGEVAVLDVSDGIVRLRLGGACSGCTGSAVTLREGVEAALRAGFAGFVRMEVQEDRATAHPPPGPTLLQIGPRPA